MELTRFRGHLIRGLSQGKEARDGSIVEVISAAEFVNIQRLDFTWDDVGTMTTVKDFRNVELARFVGHGFLTFHAGWFVSFGAEGGSKVHYRYCVMVRAAKPSGCTSLS